jgi:hypothetical protein
MRNEREPFRKHRELGLAKPRDLRARHQYGRRATTCSDEWASLRKSAGQVQCQRGGLGISVEALRGWASEVDLQFVPKSKHQAGLPKDVVLYCARHDYGTRVLMRTGNRAAVMRTMGRRDLRAPNKTPAARIINQFHCQGTRRSRR